MRSQETGLEFKCDPEIKTTKVPVEKPWISTTNEGEDVEVKSEGYARCIFHCPRYCSFPFSPPRLNCQPIRLQGDPSHAIGLSQKEESVGDEFLDPTPR